MKLLSTQIGENWIEMTYADGSELDESAPHLVLRLHREIDQAKSPAWNRYWTLTELREFIDAQLIIERDISEGRTNRG